MHFIIIWCWSYQSKITEFIILWFSYIKVEYLIVEKSSNVCTLLKISYKSIFMRKIQIIKNDELNAGTAIFEHHELAWSYW